MDPYLCINQEIDPDVVNSPSCHGAATQLIYAETLGGLPLAGLYNSRRLRIFEPREGTKLAMDEMTRTETHETEEMEQEGGGGERRCSRRADGPLIATGASPQRGGAPVVGPLRVRRL